MTEQSDSKKKKIWYVAPAPGLVDEMAHKVCHIFAETNSSFARSEIVYGFAAFLNVVSRMQADYLNNMEQNNEIEALDSDTQSD